MVKYTAEDRLQVVERYLSEKESTYDLTESMGTDNKEISGNNMNTMVLNFY